MEHALQLLKSEKPEDYLGRSIDEETIFLKPLGRRVPMSKALDIVREVGRHFGGKVKLSPEQRQERAQKAIQARWGKRKGPKRQK